MRRPAMSSMLGYMDMHPHREYEIIFDDLKRFARDVVFHLKLRNELRARNATPNCLNFSFEDTPEGEFVETIMAAQGELERKQNKRQVIQKQKARLEKGYWAFYPPPGYKSAKHELHGKLLVAYEPHASIIKETYEGYASNRFLEQKDVQKILQEKDFSNGKYVHLQKVKRLLTRVIYAGYIEYPDWEVDRREGHHKAIIDLETFNKVKNKLEGKALVRTREDYDKSFPLRGHVRCSVCRALLTASMSTGRVGKRYPYYRCTNRNCKESTKSIKKEDVETEFKNRLIQAKPNTKALEFISAIVNDAYQKKQTEVTKSADVHEKEITDIETKMRELINRVTSTNSEKMVRVYEEEIENLESRKLELKEKITHTRVNTVSVGTALNAVIEFIENPVDIWVNGDLNDKRRVIQLVFADNFEYNRVSGVGTAEYSILFRVLEQFQHSKLQHVEVAGIEPACKRRS